MWPCNLRIALGMRKRLKAYMGKLQIQQKKVRNADFMPFSPPEKFGIFFMVYHSRTQSYNFGTGFSPHRYDRINFKIFKKKMIHKSTNSKITLGSS